MCVVAFQYCNLVANLPVFCSPFMGETFSTNLLVQEAVTEAMPVLGLYLATDAMKCLCLNVLRSTGSRDPRCACVRIPVFAPSAPLKSSCDATAGRPTITLVVNAAVCLGVMLPLGWHLAFNKGYGIVGMFSLASRQRAHQMSHPLPAVCLCEKVYGEQ